MDGAFPSDVKIVPSVAPLEVDMTLHGDNRLRLVAEMKRNGVEKAGLILLQGGESEMRHDTDHEPIFRQESNFHWAFGVREPDCYGTIEYPSGRSTLFVPRLPESYAVWMGPIKTLDWWKNEYLVDEVKYVDELSDFIIAFGKTVSESEATLLYLLYGLNSDSKKYAKPAHFDGIDQFQKDMDALFPAIVEMRVFKTEKELAVLRYVSNVSSDAHMAVLQHAKPGMKEYQLESLFRHWCYYHGKCRNMSYTCICASGINGAVLHYGHAGEPNKKELFPTDICLFDMGGEYHCYGADITTSFPATGRFNEDQKLIYNTVLAAVYAVEDAMKEGVSWVDMHALAYRTILEELKKGGVLVGSVDEMMSPEVNLGAIFMPHGLGHFLGIDTHDVGGYPPGLTRPNLAGFSSLRTARVLKAGMYITVEPGCYFIGALLDKALQDPVQSKYLVPEKIERFRKFGGVRIEDNVLVTKDGIENFTDVPRSVEDIEAVMAGKITSRSQLTKRK